MCVFVCLCMCVRGLDGGGGYVLEGLKEMQVLRSAICCATVLGWYLTTCWVEFKYTHTHTSAHTDVHKHTGLEGRDEISTSSASL